MNRFFLEQDPENSSLLYGTLYLTLLVVSKANRCSILRRILCSTILNVGFVERLAQIKLKNEQLAKIMPILLSHILHIKKSLAHSKHTKIITFSVLESQFDSLLPNLLYCLRAALRTATLTEI